MRTKFAVYLIDSIQDYSINDCIAHSIISEDEAHDIAYEYLKKINKEGKPDVKVTIIKYHEL